jgi:hypothetical protein
MVLLDAFAFWEQSQKPFNFQIINPLTATILKMYDFGETFDEITQNLTTKEVLTLCATRREFQEYCNDPRFWRRKSKTMYVGYDGLPVWNPHSFSLLERGMNANVASDVPDVFLDNLEFWAHKLYLDFNLMSVENARGILLHENYRRVYTRLSVEADPNEIGRKLSGTDISFLTPSRFWVDNYLAKFGRTWAKPNKVPLSPRLTSLIQNCMSFTCVIENLTHRNDYDTVVELLQQFGRSTKFFHTPVYKYYIKNKILSELRNALLEEEVSVDYVSRIVIAIYQNDNLLLKDILKVMNVPSVIKQFLDSERISDERLSILYTSPK